MIAHWYHHPVSVLWLYGIIVTGIVALVGSIVALFWLVVHMDDWRDL